MDESLSGVLSLELTGEKEERSHNWDGNNKSLLHHDQQEYLSRILAID